FREVLKAPITAKFGILVILSYGFVAIFAPVLTPYGEREIVGPEFDVWGEQFILGTDGLGRDMLTRLLFGARNTVGIAFITTILAFVIGGLTGLFAAIYSGWFDQLASRVVDVLMAIPQLIFALMLLTIFGTSIPTLIIVIATLDATRIFRVTRAVSLNVVVLDYFEAARLRGERMFWLCIREILPNIMAPLMAEFGLRFCFVFLMIAALSFLGLGVQPPTADWGSMVRENAVLITYGDITPILPAIAIAVLTLGVNFLVDWFLHKSSGLKDGH
ncbi:MAG: ABC transporter permease, partial [Arenicellales bacterium]|nr:ABC transporter permease [Arenicellales bacterium]